MSDVRAAVRRVRRRAPARSGHVAELVLDRPKAMNAVSTEMARSIAAACAALAADRGRTRHRAHLHATSGPSASAPT